jgi:hypothetical protein
MAWHFLKTGTILPFLYLTLVGYKKSSGELERMWSGVVVVCFSSPSPYFPEGTEVIHEHPQSG